MPKLKIADLVFDVLRDNPMLSRQIDDYLTDAPADVVIDFDDAALQKEREAEAGMHCDFSPVYSEYLAIYRAIAEAFVDRGGFLMHGSALAFDGKGYLFTAPSGTGKSTHTRFWREVYGERVVMVNDDKPIVTCRGGAFFLSGTPWSGKHDLDANITVPLCGIVLLRRGLTDAIEPISPDGVLGELFNQIYRPADTARYLATIDLVGRMLDVCPLYRLSCTMAPSAAKIACAGLAAGACPPTGQPTGQPTG